MGIGPYKMEGFFFAVGEGTPPYGILSVLCVGRPALRPPRTILSNKDPRFRCEPKAGVFLSIFLPEGERYWIFSPAASLAAISFMASL